MEFHGIPWNCSSHRNWRTQSSMEFHGIPWNCSCHRNWRTPSSMEFHGIPWNFSCQRNWRTPNSMEFHGIPWNCSCQWNWRKASSMEFHGTSRVSEIGALQVPWNSMELLVSAKLAHFKFHGIPCNCSCHWNWRTSSSMEFHGTARVSEIGALQVPWNSIELLVSAKLAHFKFHEIPWNCSCQRNWRILSSIEFHGTARVIEIGAPQNQWNSLELLVSSKLAHS